MKTPFPGQNYEFPFLLLKTAFFLFQLYFQQVIITKNLLNLNFILSPKKNPWRS